MGEGEGRWRSMADLADVGGGTGEAEAGRGRIDAGDVCEERVVRVAKSRG